jgi:DNA-binding response OmpR family regulator
VRRFVAGQFQRAGCACLTAENAQVAVRLFARDDEIRYVLLDWYLPGDDAAELVREFDRIRPGTIVVGVSGEDRRLDFQRVGVRRFLAKPVRIEALMAELRAAGAAGRTSGASGASGAHGTNGANGAGSAVAEPAPDPGAAGDWARRLREICAEFDLFLQRRPGARATRAASIVEVLRDAWPRAMTVQEIVETLWPDPSERKPRAAGTVRNALKTLVRNFSDFNRDVSEPLHDINCELWRSEVRDSRLCTYALRIHPVSESGEAARELRHYLSRLPPPVIDSIYECIQGRSATVSPGAQQVLHDAGAELSDDWFRDLIVRVVERRRN